MKIGVLQFFSWPDRSVPLTDVYARALERIEIMDRGGFDAVWLAEHHFTGYSVCPSVHLMGMAAAARTKRLRIGMGVSLAAFYHPLRLAEEVALLDVLSGGRVNWGAGRGFSRGEFTAFGITAEESAGRFRETVEIVLAAWTNEKLNHQGEFFRFEGIEVLPKPLQQPHPPVWAAAGSDQAIEWAASKGLSVLLGPHDSVTDLAKKRRLYNATMAAGGFSTAGRDIPTARLVAIAETAERAEAVARRGAQWLVDNYIGGQHKSILQRTHDFAERDRDPLDHYLNDVILYGTPDSIVDKIHALAERAEVNYLMCAPLSRETFTLLADKVIGRLDTVGAAA